MKKEVVDALYQIFGKEIEFKVTNKSSIDMLAVIDEQQIFYLKDYARLLAIKEKLESMIKSTASDYKKAKKLFKNGDIPIDELLEYEQILNKLRNELDEVNSKLK